MEKFKNVLKRRITFMGVFNGLAIAFIVLTAYISSMKSHNAKGVDDFMHGMINGFQMGVFVGVQMLVVIYIMKYRKALKSEDELKKLYIKENDEREKVIRDKIGGVGLNFSLAVIATATVVSGFFNQTVFITLLAVLLVTVTIKAALKLYYKSKF
jgi:hypothetical protein